MLYSGWFESVYEVLRKAAVWQVFLLVVPAWLAGAITGYLLPRPTKHPLLLFFSVTFRKFAIHYHVFIIVRDVWHTYTSPGTFQALLLAFSKWICGSGFEMELPPQESEVAVSDLPSPVTDSLALCKDVDNWPITHADLEAFKAYLEEVAPPPGATGWVLILERDIPNVIRYKSWRRTNKGLTEYKSVTVVPDAGVEELVDLYFDDDFRPLWDPMIAEHSVLEAGDFRQREQVVRWLRRFPFKFLTPREYCIVRRIFREGPVVFGFARAIDHPLLPRSPGIVRMESFLSSWSCGPVACPWGSRVPCSETHLVHSEQFKVPEHLARFAVRHGMWGFVKNLAAKTPDFIARRRLRVGPFEVDAHAFGSPYKAAAAAGDPAAANREALTLTSNGNSLKIIAKEGYRNHSDTNNNNADKDHSNQSAMAIVDMAAATSSGIETKWVAIEMDGEQGSVTAKTAGGAMDNGRGGGSNDSDDSFISEGSEAPDSTPAGDRCEAGSRGKKGRSRRKGAENGMGKNASTVIVTAASRPDEGRIEGKGENGVGPQDSKQQGRFQPQEGAPVRAFPHDSPHRQGGLGPTSRSMKQRSNGPAEGSRTRAASTHDSSWQRAAAALHSLLAWVVSYVIALWGVASFSSAAMSSLRQWLAAGRPGHNNKGMPSHCGGSSSSLSPLSSSSRTVPLPPFARGAAAAARVQRGHRAVPYAIHDLESSSEEESSCESDPDKRRTSGGMRSSSAAVAVAMPMPPPSEARPQARVSAVRRVRRLVRGSRGLIAMAMAGSLAVLANRHTKSVG